MRHLKRYKHIIAAVLMVLVFIWQVFEQRTNEPDSSVIEQNQRLIQLYDNKQSDEFLTVRGKVYRILADDNKGSRHQRFLIYVNQLSVLVAHNIDLAPRVPLSVGDIVRLHGEYEYTKKGGVLHWTHHDPKGRHNGGWIEYNGKRYQ